MFFIHSLKTRRDREEGFTLIELMVVVLIIAILIAIAIPTFLGARERAQNRAAQSDLRNALAAGKVHYTDDETYTTLTAAILEGIEPSLEYDVVANSSDDIVGVGGQSDTDFVMAHESKSGDWFCIAESANGTTYGTGAAVGDVDTVAECADPEW